MRKTRGIHSTIHPEDTRAARARTTLAWPVCVVWIFLVLAGCSPLSAVPLTLKEAKDFVFGQEESFSYPMGEVLRAAVGTLRRIGFSIGRIEHFNRKGLIDAHWQDTSVTVSLDTITPRLTKIKCKFHRRSSMREYSSEEEFFNNVRETLKRGESASWERLGENMVTVHRAPDPASEVIAYLGSGEETELLEEMEDWGRISLMDNCAGFVALKHLGPGPDTSREAPR